MRMWPWLRRVSTAARVGRGFVVALQLLAGLDQPRRSCEVSTPSASSIAVASNLAHAALQRQPAVGRRATRASGPSPWCRGPAAGRRAVAQLGEEEAAAVAEIGVVGPGTDGRDSAAPAVRLSCPATARSARSGRSHSPSLSVSSPTVLAARSLRKRSVSPGKRAGWTTSKKASPRVWKRGSGRYAAPTGIRTRRRLQAGRGSHRQRDRTGGRNRGPLRRPGRKAASQPARRA